MMAVAELLVIPFPRQEGEVPATGPYFDAEAKARKCRDCM